MNSPVSQELPAGVTEISRRNLIGAVYVQHQSQCNIPQSRKETTTNTYLRTLNILNSVERRTCFFMLTRQLACNPSYLFGVKYNKLGSRPLAFRECKYMQLILKKLMSIAVTGDRHDKRAAMNLSMIAVALTPSWFVQMYAGLLYIHLSSSVLFCFRTQNYIYYTEVSCVWALLRK